MSKSNAHSAGSVILAAIEECALHSREQRFLENCQPAGLTLFRRNIAPEYREVLQLNQQIQSLLGQPTAPAIIAIDQEGGRVARLQKPFPNEGAALNIVEGRSDPEALHYIYNYGFSVGAVLKSVGVNVNFAPVADILSNPNNPVIGDRSFGRDAQSVSLRAGAFLRGMEACGVRGCLKHFPGQGAGDIDTHLGTDIIPRGVAEIEAEELQPFQQLGVECGMIMISHSIFPEIDKVPASLSKIIMQDWLRGKLGYQGLIVSDDMNMKAIAQDDKTWQDAIIGAIANGADLVLVCRHVERCEMAVEAISREAERSKAFKSRLEDAGKRVRKFRGTL